MCDGLPVQLTNQIPPGMSKFWLSFCDQCLTLSLIMQDSHVASLQLSQMAPQPPLLASPAFPDAALSTPSWS